MNERWSYCYCAFLLNTLLFKRKLFPESRSGNFSTTETLILEKFVQWKIINKNSYKYIKTNTSATDEMAIPWSKKYHFYEDDFFLDF